MAANRNTIHFRGKNYSASKLATLSPHAHIETVSTKDIIQIASAKGYEIKVAIKVDNVYHLLLGSADPNSQQQQILVITKHTLAKANVDTTTYEQRILPRNDAPWQRKFNARVVEYSQPRVSR